MLEPLSAHDLARRLVARETANGDAADGAARAAQAACERTYRELTRTVGPTGSLALLTRALAQAQSKHPLLREVRIGRVSERALDGVTDALEAHGASDVAAGLEAVLEQLVNLLGRLIGYDMVPRLVEQNAPLDTQHDQDVR